MRLNLLQELQRICSRPISLLDRALISQSINDNKQIEEPDVRTMLGLADKEDQHFKEVLSGNEKNASSILNELINDGLDAKNLNDILEVLYLFSRRISLDLLKKICLCQKLKFK